MKGRGTIGPAVIHRTRRVMAPSVRIPSSPAYCVGDARQRGSNAARGVLCVEEFTRGAAGFAARRADCGEEALVDSAVLSVCAGRGDRIQGACVCGWPLASIDLEPSRFEVLCRLADDGFLTAKLFDRPCSLGFAKRGDERLHLRRKRIRTTGAGALHEPSRLGRSPTDRTPVRKAPNPGSAGPGLERQAPMEVQGIDFRKLFEPLPRLRRQRIDPARSRAAEPTEDEGRRCVEFVSDTCVPVDRNFCAVPRKTDSQQLGGSYTPDYGMKRCVKKELAEDGASAER